MKTKKLFNVKGLKLSLRGMSLRAEGEAISKAKGIALALPRNVTQNLSFDNIKAKALSYSFFLCLLLSIFCVLTSCGKQNQAPVATNASYTSADETGQLALTLQWEGQNNSKFSAPAGVATIRIIITATGMNTVSQDFAASLGGGSITNVLAGTDRTVTAYGLDASGYIKYGGSLSGVNIAAGETTTVAIVLIAQLQSVAPTATITADSTTGNAPLNVTFTVGYTDPENTTGNYSLDFGDGTTAGTGTLASAATATVSHTYNTAGTYTATLTVTDAYGTVGTGNVAITVVTKTVKKISAGKWHTCALLSDGTIKCWGNNSNSELGNGTNANSNVPVAVTGINNATSISAGRTHTCALLSDGTIKCWGSNDSGVFGNGTKTSSNIPVLVSGINNAVSISAGAAHTCAVLSDGTIKCWGFNRSGQLGNGAFGGPTNCNFVDNFGNYCYLTPVSVSGITTGATISAGWAHTCALLSDGTIKCWGFNHQGQLGNGGTGGPEACPDYFGTPEEPCSTTPVLVSGINNAVNISAETEHTPCAILSDGTIKCWGGGYGSTPVLVSGISISVGEYHTCALLSDGTIKCWGSNDYGQLGNGTNTNSSTPVLVSGINNAVYISAKWYHTCAILSDGTIKCWGGSSVGELGNGTNTSSNVPVSVSGF